MGREQLGGAIEIARLTGHRHLEDQGCKLRGPLTTHLRQQQGLHLRALLLKAQGAASLFRLNHLQRGTIGIQQQSLTPGGKATGIGRTGIGPAQSEQVIKVCAAGNNGRQIAKGLWIAQITKVSNVAQGQMVTHQPGNLLLVLGRSTHATEQGAHLLSTHPTVSGTVGLRHIMKETGQQQGSTALPTPPCAPHLCKLNLQFITTKSFQLPHRIEQVNVDRIEMEPIVLSLAKAGRPLRNITTEEAASVHRNQGAKHIIPLQHCEKSAANLPILTEPLVNSGQSPTNLLQGVVVKSRPFALNELKQSHDGAWFATQGGRVNTTDAAPLQEKQLISRALLQLPARPNHRSRGPQLKRLTHRAVVVLLVPIETQHARHIESTQVGHCISMAIVLTHKALDGQQTTTGLKAQRPGHWLLGLKHKPVLPAAVKHMKLQSHPQQEFASISEFPIVLRLHHAAKQHVVVSACTMTQACDPTQPVKVAQSALALLDLWLQQKD